MKPIVRLSGAIALTALLCGCQSLGLPGWSFKSPRSAAMPRHAAGDYEALLAEGRAQLSAGQLSAAAASFRMASTDPKTAAEANNGLAVVYAKLGRSDLAERYFRTALALEPESQRFAANLIRLQRHVLLTRQAAAERLAAISEIVPEPRFASGKIADRITTSSGGRIERISRGSVRIRTPIELGGAPDIEVAYRERPAITEPPAETQGERGEDIQLAAAEDKSRTYPVRVVFER